VLFYYFKLLKKLGYFKTPHLTVTSPFNLMVKQENLQFTIEAEKTEHHYWMDLWRYRELFDDLTVEKLQSGSYSSHSRNKAFAKIFKEVGSI